MYVRHHFKDDQLHCSEASQNPVTLHILKVHGDSFSRIRRERKYKDKDNDKDDDKDKDTDKIPAIANMYYIFGILTTHSFQI